MDQGALSDACLGISHLLLLLLHFCHMVLVLDFWNFVILRGF